MEEIDTSGLLCPEPIMLLHRRMREIGDGCDLRLLATDPGTLRDVPDFCRHLGHQLLDQGRDGELLWFVLRKSAKAVR